MTHKPYFSFIALCIVTSLPAASPGCTAADPDEHTAEVEAALGGEPGCATASIAAPNGGTLIASASGAVAVSPDDKYNTSGCPDQYVVEVTGVPATCTYRAEWDQPMPTDAASCANARIQYHMYGFNGAWSGALFGVSAGGLWVNTFCTWGPPTITGQINTGSFTKLRVAVQAWEWVNGRGDHKFVRVRCN